MIIIVEIHTIFFDWNFFVRKYIKIIAINGTRNPSIPNVIIMKKTDNNIDMIFLYFCKFIDKLKFLYG